MRKTILHHTFLPKLVRSEINVKMADTEAKRSKYECRCNFHNKWKDFTCENVVLHSERGKVSAAVVNFLREHNFLGPRSSFLCKSCISKTKNILHQNTTTYNNNDDLSHQKNSK